MGLIDASTRRALRGARRADRGNATPGERGHAVRAAIHASEDGAHDPPEAAIQAASRQMFMRRPDPEDPWSVVACRVIDGLGLHPETVEAIAAASDAPPWAADSGLVDWARGVARGALSDAQTSVLRAADEGALEQTFEFPDLDTVLTEWDGTMWVNALEVGPLRQDGRIVDLTPGFLRDAAAEYMRYIEDCAGRGVHWRAPILVPGPGGPHVDSGVRDGDILAAEFAEDWLRVKLGWLPAAREDVLTGRKAHGSIHIVPYFVDPVSQERYEPFITEISETSNPKERRASFTDGLKEALIQQGLTLSMETHDMDLNTQDETNTKANKTDANANGEGAEQAPEGEAGETGVSAQIEPAVKEELSAMIQQAVQPLVDSINALTEYLMDEGKPAPDEGEGAGEGEGEGAQTSSGGNEGAKNEMAASVAAAVAGQLSPVLTKIAEGQRVAASNTSRQSTPGGPGAGSRGKAPVDASDAIAQARVELGEDADNEDVVRRARQLRGEA